MTESPEGNETKRARLYTSNTWEKHTADISKHIVSNICNTAGPETYSTSRVYDTELHKIILFRCTERSDWLKLWALCNEVTLSSMFHIDRRHEAHMVHMRKSVLLHTYKVKASWRTHAQTLPISGFFLFRYKYFVRFRLVTMVLQVYCHSLYSPTLE